MDPLNRNSFTRINIHRHVLSEGTMKQEGEGSKEGFFVSTALGITILIGFGFVLLVSFFVLRIYCLSSEEGEEEEQEAKPQDEANDELASFPVFVFGSAAKPPSSSSSPPPASDSPSSFEETCAICLDVYVLGDCIMVLPRCKHMFHKGCVEQWLVSHSLCCPVCRTRALGRNKASTSRNCQHLNPSLSFNFNWANLTRTVL